MKKIKLLYFLIIIIFPICISFCNDSSINEDDNGLGWIRLSGSPYFDRSYGVTCDNNGDIFIVADVMNKLAIIKYDNTGIEQWVKESKNYYRENAYDIESDSDGKIYVAGSINDTRKDYEDILLVKYDGDGIKYWSKQIGSSSYDTANSLAIDSNGNIYITGETLGSMDGQKYEGGSDIILIKYDNDGNRQWTKQIGTTNNDVAKSINIDSCGYVYIIGETIGFLDGQEYEGILDMFLAKYDSNGNKQWIKQIDLITTKGFFIDLSNNIYVIGNTRHSLDGQIIPERTVEYTYAFLMKYDNDGNKQWTRLLSNYPDSEIRGVSCNNKGDIYITGDLSHYVGADGVSDIFLAKFDNEGKNHWVESFDLSDADYSEDVTCDNNGNVYITGHTFESVGDEILAGESDIFLIKWKDK